jgi:membrane associated rhomboid family serine protease
VLREGRLDTLFTHIFLHGGWTHLLMNVGSALAFGPPVARLFGRGARGAALFLLFFLICGAFGGLGYVATHMEGSGLVVGASGAISGLWGAASRLLGQDGRLAPILGRQVVSQAMVFTVLNILIGLAGGFAQLHIAWEAHLAGYLAGLLLIGPASLLTDGSRGRELPSG